MKNVLSYILFDLERAGICDGVPSNSAQFTL